MIHRFILSSAVFAYVMAPTTFLAQSPVRSGCTYVPREDSSPSICAPPTSEAITPAPPVSAIALVLPAGVPLRIVIAERVRIKKPGQTVHGRVAETVYAFDQPLIPAGSEVAGRITRIEPVSKGKR